MQNNVQSLLLTHRENYSVPKGQEQSVHCKIAKVDESGNFVERPRLVHFGVKEFEIVTKENLEAMGYTVEILYHPLGRYGNAVITDKDAELKAKDAEIAMLKAQLAKAEPVAESPKEEVEITDESPKEESPEKPKKVAPKGTKGKGKKKEA